MTIHTPLKTKSELRLEQDLYENLVQIEYNHRKKQCCLEEGQELGSGVLEDVKDWIRNHFRMYKRMYIEVKQPELATYQDICIIKAVFLSQHLPLNSLYRDSRRIIPAVMYLELKLRGVPFYINRLFANDFMTRKEFNRVLQRVSPFHSEYLARDKKAISKMYISNLADEFKFPQQFLDVAEQVTERYWENLSYGKEQMIAGIACCITATLMQESLEIENLGALCDYLGISYGAVYSPIRALLAKYGHIEVEGFPNSSGIVLRRFLPRSEKNRH